MAGYQAQFAQQPNIDFSLIISVNSELRERGFTQAANDFIQRIITTYDKHLTSSASEENERQVLAFAVQLWQIGYQDHAKAPIDSIGKSYQHKIEKSFGNGSHRHIEKSLSVIQQVMTIANDFWQRAQEQPDIAVYDTIAERLWQAIVIVLEEKLALDRITKDNLELYYLLLKTYQAVREPVKCAEVGLKMLGVAGFQGYKDVRQIVDNLVTSGFQEQQWQLTSDSRMSTRMKGTMSWNGLKMEHWKTC